MRREDLLAVRASGPRGSAARRQETRAHPVLVEAGPYLVGGHLHAPPDVDPLTRIRGPEAMIPLTEAWISYRSGRDPARRRVGTIIVNRDRAERMERVTEAALADAAPAIAGLGGAGGQGIGASPRSVLRAGGSPAGRWALKTATRTSPDTVFGPPSRRASR